MADGAGAPPPPPPRTKWTRRVPHPVLTGHAASLSQARFESSEDKIQFFALKLLLSGGLDDTRPLLAGGLARAKHGRRGSKRRLPVRLPAKPPSEVSEASDSSGCSDSRLSSSHSEPSGSDTLSRPTAPASRGGGRGGGGRGGGGGGGGGGGARSGVEAGTNVPSSRLASDQVERKLEVFERKLADMESDAQRNFAQARAGPRGHGSPLRLLRRCAPARPEGERLKAVILCAQMQQSVVEMAEAVGGLARHARPPRPERF